MSSTVNNNSVNRNYKSVLYTGIVIIACALYGLYIFTTHPKFEENIDLASVLFEGLLTLFVLVGLVVVSANTDKSYSFFSMHLGLSFLLFAFMTDTLDEFVDMHPAINFWVEGVCQNIGFLLLVYGLSVWLKRIHEILGETDHALTQLKIKDKELENANRLLAQSSVTDHLTHLYNRQKLDVVLDQELGRALRYSTRFGVIMMDVDHFKQVNDIHGHPIGDQVLIDLATILRSNSRKEDIVGRWGGEEFLIICPELDRTGLMAMAEKLRKEISIHKFPVIGHKTASFGITAYKSEDNISELIVRVDRALYQAKENGRNQTSEML